MITRAEDLLPNLYAGDEVTTLKYLYSARKHIDSLRRDLSGDSRQHRDESAAQRT